MFFTISVIFLKMGKHSDFRISSFQVVDVRRILQFNRRIEKYFKEFIWFWRTMKKTRRTLSFSTYSWESDIMILNLFLEFDFDILRKELIGSFSILIRNKRKILSPHTATFRCPASWNNGQCEVMNIWKSYVWTAKWKIIWKKIIAVIDATFAVAKRNNQCAAKSSTALKKKDQHTLFKCQCI